jgi:hypothetical protein
MAKVNELANEVQQLNRDELAEFRDWFRKYDSDEWDKEIEQDVLAGKLDKLGNEAIAEQKRFEALCHTFVLGKLPTAAAECPEDGG